MTIWYEVKATNMPNKTDDKIRACLRYRLTVCLSSLFFINKIGEILTPQKTLKSKLIYWKIPQ